MGRAARGRHVDHAEAQPGGGLGWVSRPLSAAGVPAGVSGSGVVATLNFTATGAGTSAVSVTDAGLRNTQNQAIASAPGDVIVTVQ